MTRADHRSAGPPARETRTAPGSGTVPEAGAGLLDARRAPPDLGFEPLRHKLYRPRTGLALVPRQALVSKLRQTDVPIVLLSAPAGCGKTTTLTQLADADERPVAWLTLDAGDNDELLFTSYLAWALRSVAPVPDTVFELMRENDPRCGSG